MTARHATELLYDSEAALRLVDSAIEDLRDADARDIASVSDILNGLDRAVALVDEMDRKAAEGDAAAGAALRNKLRDELFSVRMGSESIRIQSARLSAVPTPKPNAEAAADPERR